MPTWSPQSSFYALLQHLPRVPSLHWLAVRLANVPLLLGVAGVIRDDLQRLLLFEHTYRRIPWGLPGGWMKPAESPLAALEREVLEESGLVIKADRLLLIGTTPDRPKMEFVVSAHLVSGTFRPSNEVSNIRWFAPDSLPLMAGIHRQILHRIDTLPAGEVGWYVTRWAGHADTK